MYPGIHGKGRDVSAPFVVCPGATISDRESHKKGSAPRAQHGPLDIDEGARCGNIDGLPDEGDEDSRSERPRLPSMMDETERTEMFLAKPGEWTVIVSAVC